MLSKSLPIHGLPPKKMVRGLPEHGKNPTGNLRLSLYWDKDVTEVSTGDLLVPIKKVEALGYLEVATRLKCIGIHIISNGKQVYHAFKLSFSAAIVILATLSTYLLLRYFYFEHKSSIKGEFLLNKL